MEQPTKLLLLLSLLVASAAVPACKAKEAEKKAKPASANATTPTPSVGSDDEDGDDDEEDCEDSSHDEDEHEDDEHDNDEELEDEDSDLELRARSSRGFNLASVVTYADIESIIESKCVTCHGSGGSSPVLDSYTKVRSNATAMASAIEDGSMPMAGSPKLTSTEKSKFSDWIDGGRLESTPEDEPVDEEQEEDEHEDEEEDSSNPCDDVDEHEDEEDDDDFAGFDTESAFQDLLNPEKLEECHKSGKLYDRGKKACHVANIAKSFDCTASGVVQKFKSMGKTVSLDSGELAGYTIDQCGELDSQVFIFFYKRVQETSEEVGLSLKYMCSSDCKR